MRLSLLGASLVVVLGCQVEALDDDEAGAAREGFATAPGDTPSKVIATPPDSPTPPEPPPAPLPHVPFSPPQVLPPGTCAPPAGDWTGTARVEHKGPSGNFTTITARVTWSLASTDGCLDRYVPSGTVTVERVPGPCCRGWPANGATELEPSDGELVVDRSTLPPTFTMTGETRWEVEQSCSGSADLCLWSGPGIGGRWADHHGELAGDVVGGHWKDGPTTVDWQFTRAGVVLPPDGEACSQPAVDHWAGLAAVGPAGGRADLNWTRVSTEGCRDRYVPSGRVHVAPPADPQCVEQVLVPEHGTIAPGDGQLVIDRSHAIPTAYLQGSSRWQAQVSCMRDDGTSTVRPLELHATWATGESQGSFLGDRFAGGTAVGSHVYSWAAHAIPAP